MEGGEISHLLGPWPYVTPRLFTKSQTAQSWDSFDERYVSSRQGWWFSCWRASLVLWTRGCLRGLCCSCQQWIFMVGVIVSRELMSTAPMRPCRWLKRALLFSQLVSPTVGKLTRITWICPSFRRWCRKLLSTVTSWNFNWGCLASCSQYYISHSSAELDYCLHHMNCPSRKDLLIKIPRRTVPSWELWRALLVPAPFTSSW